MFVVMSSQILRQFPKSTGIEVVDWDLVPALAIQAGPGLHILVN